MRLNKNHEEYHDLTACIAVRRASRQSCYKRKSEPLIYLIGEKKGIVENH